MIAILVRLAKRFALYCPAPLEPLAQRPRRRKRYLMRPRFCDRLAGAKRSQNATPQPQGPR